MLSLIACADDYLLQEAIADAVDQAQQAFAGVDPEFLEEMAPEAVALEINSPSLFAAQRILVVPAAEGWVTAPTPAGASRATSVDVTPLVRCLEAGLPEDVALIVGVWCAAKPRGELVDVFSDRSRFTWIPLPPPPKPWEDVELSDEQRQVLRSVVQKAVPEASLTPAAANLLLQRLGFAPRLLAQEVRKLATAAGEAQKITEELVRQLTFVREHSLEGVRDAVLDRDGLSLFRLVAAAGSGQPVSDWRGQRLEAARLPVVLFGQIHQLVSQMLFIGTIAAQAGMAEQLEPSRTSTRGWYSQVFKSRLGPTLLELLSARRITPFSRTGKPPSVWSLGQVFAGAGRYRARELVAALACSGTVEAKLRGPFGLETLTQWLGTLFSDLRQVANESSGGAATTQRKALT